MIIARMKATSAELNFENGAFTLGADPTTRDKVIVARGPGFLGIPENDVLLLEICRNARLSAVVVN